MESERVMPDEMPAVDGGQEITHDVEEVLVNKEEDEAAETPQEEEQRRSETIMEGVSRELEDLKVIDRDE